MRFNFLIFLACLTITGCMQQDYLSSPKKLQEAINTCEQESLSRNCDHIKNTAIQINKFIAELTQDPQEYGKTILNLQMQLSKHYSKELVKEIKLRLIVARWFESPGNR